MKQGRDRSGKMREGGRREKTSLSVVDSDSTIPHQGVRRRESTAQGVL